MTNTKNLLLHVSMARTASHKGDGWSPATFVNAMEELGARDAGNLFDLANKVVLASEKLKSLDPSKQWSVLRAAAEASGESTDTSMVFAGVVTEMIHPSQFEVRQAGLSGRSDVQIPMEIVAQVLPEYAKAMEPMGLSSISFGTLVSAPMFKQVKTGSGRVYTYMDQDGNEYHSMTRRVGPFTARLEIMDSVGMPATIFMRGLRDQLRPGPDEE